MKAPDEILRQNAETYQDKNADYGDSWRLAGKTLAMWLQHAGMEDVTLPADEDTWNSIGLFTRRLDKLVRSFNAEFVVDELNFESTADAHEDESTYAAMAASLTRESQTVEYENTNGAGIFGADPETTDGGYVRVADAVPEYEAAYRRLRGGDE